MSQNLTQPEEIDHVLMEMAGHDTKAGVPIQDGAKLDGAKCNGSIGATGSSYGIAHGKPAHCLPDP